MASHMELLQCSTDLGIDEEEWRGAEAARMCRILYSGLISVCLPLEILTCYLTVWKGRATLWAP